MKDKRREILEKLVRSAGIDGEFHVREESDKVHLLRRVERYYASDALVELDKLQLTEEEIDQLLERDWNHLFSSEDNYLGRRKLAKAIIRAQQRIFAEHKR